MKGSEFQPKDTTACIKLYNILGICNQELIRSCKITFLGSPKTHKQEIEEEEEEELKNKMKKRKRQKVTFSEKNWDDPGREG